MSPHQSAKPSSLRLLFSLLTAQAFVLLFCVVASNQMPYALVSVLVVPLLIRLLLSHIDGITQMARQRRPEEWRTLVASFAVVLFVIGTLVLVFLAAILGMQGTVFWSMEGLFAVLVLSTIVEHNILENGDLTSMIGGGWYLQGHLAGVLLGFVLAYLEYDAWYIRATLLLSLALFLGSALLIVWRMRQAQIQTNSAISRTASTRVWRRLNRLIIVLVACIIGGIALTTHAVVDWSILLASFPITPFAPYRTGPGKSLGSGTPTGDSLPSGHQVLGAGDLALLRLVLLGIVLIMLISFALIVVWDGRRWLKRRRPHRALMVPQRSAPAVVAPPEEVLSGMRASYRALLIAAARKDEQLQRQTDETPQEYAMRLATTLATIDGAAGPPEWQQAMGAFTHLYQRARYRGDVLGDAELAQAQLLYQSLRKWLH